MEIVYQNGNTVYQKTNKQIKSKHFLYKQTIKWSYFVSKNNNYNPSQSSFDENRWKVNHQRMYHQILVFHISILV